MIGSRFVRTAGALAGVALAATLVTAPAAAGGPATWYVGQPLGVAGASGCASPDFPTIQAAVDASGPRDTIRVCPGVYHEAVLIAGPQHNGLTVIATKPWKATVRPAALTAGYLAGFAVGEARNVRIQGFRIRVASGGACVAVDYGIRLNANARNVIIRANRIFASGSNTLSGPCGLTTGVSVAQGASASILWNLITDFRLTGVEVTDGSSATVARNSIRFRHAGQPTLTIQGEGVNVVAGGSAIVRGNAFVGLESAMGFTAAAPTTTAQLRYAVRTVGAASGLVVRNNLVRYAFRGFKLTQTDSGSVTDNTVRDVADTGIRFVTSDGGVVAGNTVERAGAHGISMEGGSSDNAITGNDVDGSADEDCRDDSSGGSGTAGTFNTWSGNIADDDTPAGICVPI